MGEQSLIAVIGDLIDSKNIENRFVVQERLKEILEEVNRYYKSCIQF